VKLFGIKAGMPQNFGSRALKRKKWDTVSRDHSNITVMCWKDKRGRYITPSASEWNFWYEL
jgi:hypothetical protein